MNYFYCSSVPPVGERVTLDAGESQHALRVLRLGEGEMLRLVDGSGVIGEAIIDDRTGTSRHPELICLVQRCVQVPRPVPRLHLYVAPPRAKHMAQIVRQATELGVWRIVTIICAYSVARPDEHVVDGHWRGEAIAALKQSGNPFLPILDPPVSVKEGLANGCPPGFYGAVPCSESDHGADDCKPVSPCEAPDIGLWIGPEGGFSDAEISAFQAAGLVPLTVGRWVLRVETAVPALLGKLLTSGF